MIYLDNAATTFPKPREVIHELNECVWRYCGNPGRGSHKLSLMASEKIYEAREEIAKLLSVKNEECVVFTTNATYALNLALKTSINDGAHVIISDIEHNSVTRPLCALQKSRGIRISAFNSDAEDLKAEIERHITQSTTYIVSTLTSNVTGKEIPLSILSDVKKTHGIKLIVDASQLIGHKRINLSKTPCDILCAPGHKGLFGIQGVGLAIFLDGEQRQSFIEGGSGNDSRSQEMPELLPERFEAGTLPTPSIATLCRGVQFIKDYGIDAAEQKITRLSHLICERILALKGAVLLSEYENGVIPFNIGNVPSSVVSSMLDKRGVCTRGGLHCAPSVHKKLGTLDGGAVRVSVSLLNTKKDADGLYKALKEITSVL